MQKVQWVGASTSTDAHKRVLYAKAKAAGVELTLGQVVSFDVDEDVLAEYAASTKAAAEAATAAGTPLEVAPAPLPAFGIVYCLYEDAEGDKMLQVSSPDWHCPCCRLRMLLAWAAACNLALCCCTGMPSYCACDRSCLVFDGTMFLCL